jgi:hypothetical protein
MASVTRRLGVGALLVVTLAACADVLGIGELPLAVDDAGSEGGGAVESSAPDASGAAPVDGGPTDDVGAADVTTEAAADASSRDGEANVAHDAAPDHSAGCSDGGPCACATSCVGGCCDTATGQCVSGAASESCGTSGGACVNCSSSSLGHLCLAQGVCGCNGTPDCPAGLACQTSHYCGPGP